MSRKANESSQEIPGVGLLFFSLTSLLFICTEVEAQSDRFLLPALGKGTFKEALHMVSIAEPMLGLALALDLAALSREVDPVFNI